MSRLQGSSHFINARALLRMFETKMLLTYWKIWKSVRCDGRLVAFSTMHLLEKISSLEADIPCPKLSAFHDLSLQEAYTKQHSLFLQATPSDPAITQVATKAKYLDHSSAATHRKSSL